MGQTRPAMIAFAHYLAVFDHHRPHHGIGRYPARAFGRQAESKLHEIYFRFCHLLYKPNNRALNMGDNFYYEVNAKENTMIALPGPHNELYSHLFALSTAVTPF
jgi:hypothetical protein